MSLYSRLRSWSRMTLRRSLAEQEMDAELRFHLEAYAEDLVRSGVPPREALQRAHIEFGGVDKAKEECREARGGNLIEGVVQDLCYGARMMSRAPGFTITAIIALGLGIGANAAIFTVVNAILLRPLSYEAPERLVTILPHNQNPVAVANYIDWRDQSRSFETMGAADYWTPNLTGVDSPEHLRGLLVTQNLLPMLGVRPLLGRLFAVGEDQNGAEHEVILSYRLWQRRFSGDPKVLGNSITLNGQPYVIVGVMPSDFQFAPFWATHAELWAPNAFGERVHNRGGNSLRVFARLKPGVDLAQARAEMAAITAQLERQYPNTNRDVVVTSLLEQVVGKVQSPLLVLLAAVAFLLLIACANVAHMQLARAAVRHKELALRAALGARRTRLIRQFLTENLLLAAAGAVVGLLLAVWGTHVLVTLSPANLPRVEAVRVDSHVVLFLLGVSVLASVASGVAPAVQASAVNLSDALKQGGRTTTEGIRANRLRSFLVASEFALALMLLIGAGLMVRSFFALQSVDPGFNPHNVLSMTVSVAGSKEAEGGNRAIFYRQVLERVWALAVVESAAGINHLPLWGDLWGWPFLIDGRPAPRPGESPVAVYRIVTPGYFQTMRLPLVRGRDFTFADNLNSPGVAIINEQAAQTFWPGQDPLGQRISSLTTHEGRAPGTPSWLTVVGIAKNAKQGDWASAPDPEVYLATFQNREFLTNPGAHTAYITLVVRTAGDPGALVPSVKDAVRSIDRNLPISDVVTMDRVVREANAQPRFEMLVLGIFAAVALVMAAVGIYGVMSYSVSQRTQEIGIRVSLGATRGDVLRLVLREGMILALLGSAVGIAGALLLSRFMSNLLYGVQPTDAVTFIGVAYVLSMVALMATYIPARRATRVDLIVALRYE